MTHSNRSMTIRGRFEGKAALISGGAGGIGRATAERLLAEGAEVMIADLDRSRVDTVAGELGCPGAVLDVTSSESWSELTDAAERSFGRLDVLVNSAGLLKTGSILESSLEEWRLVRAVNLDGVFFGCRAALPAMRRGGGGSIVNVSSISGYRADPRTVAYDATKSGVRALTREAAVYCARNGYGVRCNAVLPGSVATRMMSDLQASDPAVYDDWIEGMPMKRPADPAEIAGLIAFLSSSDAGFITGAEYVIDGGATL